MRRSGVTGLAPGMLLLVVVVVVAGAAALFATYWDDAWHTDLGRDHATIPPHLLLYGAVAMIGAVVAAWGLAALRRSRSLPAVLRQPPLLLAATGATVTLAAAPIDAGRPGRLVQHRQLSQPTGRAPDAGPPTGEVAVGALLYLVGGPLLALTARRVRRLTPTPHATTTST